MVNVAEINLLLTRT